jgi:hypothetical protein
VSILGMTAATIGLMQNNLANETRNTAVRVSSQVANDLFAQDFDLLADGGGNYTVPFKGGTRTFVVAWVVLPKAGVKQIQIDVSYELRGQTYTNSTVLFRPDPNT